jgi:hypothetical protein
MLKEKMILCRFKATLIFYIKLDILKHQNFNKHNYPNDTTKSALMEARPPQMIPRKDYSTER